MYRKKFSIFVSLHVHCVVKKHFLFCSSSLLLNTDIAVFVRESLQSNHARQSLAQPLQPCSLGRLLNLPDQILEICRLALWL